ncbi:MAG: hypothetical protein LBU11_13305 [Zoogloeaceae bacterium]|jgi:hypothetical protein|nr:hypothetical protein [Zoogloeaceae bacterium]
MAAFPHYPQPNKPSGTFTPGAAFDVDAVIEIMRYCGTVAAWFATHLDDDIDKALAKLGNPPSMSAAVATPLPNIPRPNVAIPEYAAESEVIQIAQNVSDLIDRLLPIYTNFHKTYFPLTQATGAAAEIWMQRVLGGQGLEDSMRNALWEKERARVWREADREADRARTAYAGRGFSLPPGALLAAERGIREQAQRDLSAASREITIQEIELIKFAVDKAISLRSLAMEAANGYIDALVSSVVKAGEFFERQNDGQQKLINAVANWYTAESNAQKILWEARVDQARLTQEASKTNMETVAEYAKAQAQLIAQEAESTAKLASAAVNNLQMNASVGYSTSLSG